MEAFFAQVSEVALSVVQTINNYMSNYVLTILLIGVGIFFTVKTKFVQVRYFGEGMRRVFGKFSLKGGKQEGGLSSFQALTTAIAAQVGTGNIVGACGAIIIGGPGAIFWMWVIAFFGMATIYAEATLAQKTRVVDKDGNVKGGPVYYIKTAFKGKFGKVLAGFFAIAITLALGFIGSMVQSNSIASSLSNAINTVANGAFTINSWHIGIIVAIVAAFIFLGGINRIASVTEKLVPFMAVFYIIGCLIVLCINIKYIPETFALIFKYAFSANAILGGGIGAAIMIALQQGAKRGLFSNEAGMGSTPHAHAMAKVEKAHDQGCVAMIGVFIDTFIVLTLTALVVISSLFTGEGGFVNTAITEGSTISALTENAGITSSNMMQVAYTNIFGENIGTSFVAICLLFFAFSTIIGWNFFGRINFEYLFGKKTTMIYSIISILFIFLGSCFESTLVWELSDMFNNLMVIPNVIALIALSSLVIKSVNSATEDRKLAKHK